MAYILEIWLKWYHSMDTESQPNVDQFERNFFLCLLFVPHLLQFMPIVDS